MRTSYELLMRLERLLRRLLKHERRPRLLNRLSTCLITLPFFSEAFSLQEPAQNPNIPAQKISWHAIKKKYLEVLLLLSFEI